VTEARAVTNRGAESLSTCANMPEPEYFLNNLNPG
jgi:hypothetical protein